MNGKERKRSVFSWLVCLVPGAFVLLLGCLGCGSPVHPKEEDAPVVKPQVHILVFDPTVFEPGERGELEVLTKKLSAYLKRRIPQKASVAVFVIGNGIVQASPEVKYFDPKVDIKGMEEHQAEIAKYLQGLAANLGRAWEEAHKEEQVRIPSSCILSSLAAVERNLGVFPKNSEISLVLLSDMVESCDEWGNLISIERGAEEIEKLQRLEAGVTLSRLSKVTVVQLPSRFGMTPRETRMIESFWRSFFVEKAKVPEGRLSYLPDFPGEG